MFRADGGESLFFAPKTRIFGADFSGAERCLYTRVDFLTPFVSRVNFLWRSRSIFERGYFAKGFRVPHREVHFRNSALLFSASLDCSTKRFMQFFY